MCSSDLNLETHKKAKSSVRKVFNDEGVLITDPKKIIQEIQNSYTNLCKRGVCKSADPCPFFAKTVDPPKCLFKSETITTSEKRSVKVQNETGTCECYSVNFAQM